MSASVKLGINPMAWTNDDVPSLGGDTSLETCLRETKQAGYRGTELGGKFPREVAQLRPLLQQHALELVSGWFDGRIAEREVAEEFDAIHAHLSLLKELGCKVVVYADTSFGRHGNIDNPISQRPVLPADAWVDYGRKITQLAEKMADFGVRMAFHHHMGTIIESDEEVDLLMRHSGQAVGLLLDTGHSMCAGGNPGQLVRKHVARIVHVHCKDVRAPQLAAVRARDASFLAAIMDGVFTVPGDGSVDYVDILGVLAKQGYQGWLVVEADQDPAKAHPLTCATLGYNNLRSLAEQAGFVVTV